jgi:predicted RNase H-like nuclease
MRLAGIDGCKDGWVAVIADAGNLASARLLHLSDLVAFLNREAIDFALIDMPIGFVDGPQQRDVETAMRAFLPGKSSSVFNTPCRMALGEPTYFDASFVNEQALGKRLPKQSFALFPKMREVDLSVRLVGQTRLREGHPEVSFAAMNGNPVLSKKREVAGQSDRAALLHAAGIPAEAMLQAKPKGKIGSDDILDAAALLWSAARYCDTQHVTFPPVPLRDSVGLEMSVIA